MSIRDVIMAMNQGALDAARFQDIVRRHELLDAWTKFERQFLSGTP